jgi:steroid 5-alpha reductase family enzyme
MDNVLEIIFDPFQKEDERYVAMHSHLQNSAFLQFIIQFFIQENISLSLSLFVASVSRVPFPGCLS